MYSCYFLVSILYLYNVQFVVTVTCFMFDIAGIFSHFFSFVAVFIECLHGALIQCPSDTNICLLAYLLT